MYVAVGAMAQRDGDSLFAVKTVSEFTVYGWMMPLSCAHCARGLCMLCMCVCVRGPSESLAMCQIHCSCRITVNHRVVWHIVLTFALLDVCFLCVFMVVVAVCCET